MSPDQLGFYTLLKKEVMRFVSVLAQTVAAPVVTALLYLLVFAQALEGRASAYEGISYTQFLLPGLVMMTVIQNAFANTSSSVIQSKLMGNLVFLMMSPLGPWEWFIAYVLAALIRVLLASLAMLAATLPFIPLPFEAPGFLIAQFLCAGGSLAALGLVTGIIAQRFDHIAAVTNFIIAPASFLSGVFYSVHALPPVWYTISHFNPFFYMIDGFRYGFFGYSDVSPWISLGWSLGFFILCSIGTMIMLSRGYKLRH